MEPTRHAGRHRGAGGHLRLTQPELLERDERGERLAPDVDPRAPVARADLCHSERRHRPLCRFPAGAGQRRLRAADESLRVGRGNQRWNSGRWTGWVGQRADHREGASPGLHCDTRHAGRRARRRVDAQWRPADRRSSAGVPRAWRRVHRRGERHPRLAGCAGRNGRGRLHRNHQKRRYPRYAARLRRAAYARRAW